MSLVKNVAGQKIGAQMVSATDGSAFTGAVTVSVTVDAGTQATGSVGSGACTHEGNGYHTYAPAQAEMNGALIAFTFTGTGAIPVTVQCFTIGYDPTATVVPSNVTHNNGAAIQLPSAAEVADLPTNAELATSQAAADDATLAALAAVEAKIDTVDTVVDAIKAKTDALPADPADQSLVIAATDAIITVVDAILVDTAEIGAAGAGLTNINLPNQTMDIVGNITGNLSGSVGSVTGAVGSIGANGVALASVAADLRLALGMIHVGVAAAIDDDSITLASGHGITATTVLVYLVGGTDAVGKSRVATYSGTGDVFDVIQPWNDGETTPSGTIVYVVVPSPSGAFAANVTEWMNAPVQTPNVPGVPIVDISAMLAAVEALVTTQMTESYAAAGVAPTVAQALFLIQQVLTEFSVSGVTQTVKKLDKTTPAATFTLDDAADPTSITRTT